MLKPRTKLEQPPLNFAERIYLRSGHHYDAFGSLRWPNWESALKDYESIRDAFLADEQTRRLWPPFVEFVREHHGDLHAANAAYRAAEQAFQAKRQADQMRDMRPGPIARPM